MTFGTTPQNGPASWQNRFVNTRLSTLQVSAPGLEYSVPVCDDGDDMCIYVKHNSWRVDPSTVWTARSPCCSRTTGAPKHIRTVF